MFMASSSAKLRTALPPVQKKTVLHQKKIKRTHKLLSSTSLKSMKMEEEVEIIFNYNCPEEDLDIFRK